jgi:hypothetical protein
MEPPPANWKPHLKGALRAWTWWRAAGVNKDGSAKSSNAHEKARHSVLHKERIRVITEIDPEDRTPVQIKYLDAHLARLAVKKKSAKKRNADPEKAAHDAALRKKYSQTPEGAASRSAISKKWRKTPKGVSKGAASMKKWRKTPKGVAASARGVKKSRMKKHTKKLKATEQFIVENSVEVDVDETPLSDQEAFNRVLAIIGDKDSVVGAKIFDTLGEQTLRQAFWDGCGNHAMYPCAARGNAGVDIGAAAESIRFMVKDPGPILRHADDNKDFKYSQESFKELGLVYIPIYITNSYANCTTFESAFQLFFDFLPIGSHRLWKQSGTGVFHRPLRTGDMKYIKETGDLNPKFFFGITVLKNVNVVEMEIDSEVVKSITGGNEVACNVNQPILSTPIMTKSQEEARAAVYATLPRNWVDQATRKRKADELQLGEA